MLTDVLKRCLPPKKSILGFYHNVTSALLKWNIPALTNIALNSPVYETVHIMLKNNALFLTLLKAWYL